MQIYLARNNEQAGPYSLEQVNEMLATNQVLLTDLAWHQGMKEWKPIGELTQGQLRYQPNMNAPLSEPTTPLPKPVDSVNLKKPTSTSTALASINKRVLAKVIDFLLLWIPSSMLFGQFVTPEFVQKYQAIAGKSIMPTVEQQEQLLTLIGTLPSAAYYAVAGFVLAYFVLQAFLLHKFGQTVGKKIMGIMIVDDQTHQKTNITRSFLIRSVVFIILSYFLFIISLVDFGFMFSKRNRTLHDRLAKTVVVDVPK